MPETDEVVDWDLFAIVQGQGWQVLDDGRIRNNACQCPAVALACVVKGDTYIQPVDVQYATLVLYPNTGVDYRCHWRGAVVGAADYVESTDRLHLMYALGMIDTMPS